MNQNAYNAFLICSGIYPLVAALLGALMIVAYVRSKGGPVLKPLAAIPAAGLLYAIVYTSVYCAVSFRDGGFAPIFVVRSFEGFALDLIIWLALLLHSSKPSTRKRDLTDEEKMDITNY